MPDTTAPFVVFDLAPVFGTLGGMVQVELAARTLLALPDGQVEASFPTVAHLRCSPAAAADLVAALTKALAMLEQAPEPAAETRNMN